MRQEAEWPALAAGASEDQESWYYCTVLAPDRQPRTPLTARQEGLQRSGLVGPSYHPQKHDSEGDEIDRLLKLNESRLNALPTDQCLDRVQGLLENFSEGLDYRRF